MPSSASHNFVRFIRDAASRHPERTALALPDIGRLRGPEIAERASFSDLWRRIEILAATLRRKQVGLGDRVLVLVPLSVDLYAAVLAAMAIGAVAVLAPAGSGLKPFRNAVAAARPQGVIGTRATLRLRWLVPSLWSARAVRTGIQHTGSPPLELAEVGSGAGALLTFTSGSTGRPKGAVRTHGTLSAQHRALDASHPVADTAVALTCFPVVALHHLCCGTPTVLPAVDLKDISSVRPDWVLRQLASERITDLTGPPPFVQALADHALSTGAPVEGLRQIGIGGGPVGRSLLEAAAKAFPSAVTAVIYGSTEAEPVASVHASELLALPAEEIRGYPAGFDDPAARVMLVRVEDAPVRLEEGERLADLAVADGEWGEVIVSGSHVVERYVGAPEEEERNKIRDEAGTVWHRMGDVACRDERGMLWLGGRVGRMIPGAHGPMAPFPLEIAIERQPDISRAVLHVWRGNVVLWIEGTPTDEDIGAVRAILAHAGLPDVEMRGGVRIPVDPRHQWKVDYAALDRMAQKGGG
ncbi:MAG: AMP-binding protein [Rhodothermales bacterium]